MIIINTEEKREIEKDPAQRCQEWTSLHNMQFRALIGALLHLIGDFFLRGVLTSILLHAQSTEFR